MNKLPENNKVCLYALRGCHIQTEGGVVPCCIARTHHHELNKIDFGKRYGDESIQQQRNNEFHVKLRKDLYHGIETPTCETCWESERVTGHSYRTEVASQNPGLLETIDIKSDGTLSDDIINFWDIRDTNKCNMKCLNCNPGYSSLFNQESLANQNDPDYANYTPLTPRGDTAVFESFSKDEIHSQILPVLNENTKHIYFAGGEPLISDSHYYILQYLVDNDYAKNVKLFYNTNMLKLSHFGIDITTLWDQFKDVVLGISIDAVGERAEWARYGTNWSTIDNNLKKLAENKKIKLNVNSTQSPYTIFKMDQVINWFHSNIEYREIRSYGVIRFSYAVGSDKWNMQVLPYDMRENIIKELEKNYDVYNEYKFSHFELFKHHMLDNSWDQQRIDKARRDLKYYLNLMDRVRSTNWEQQCPELVPVLSSV